MAYVREYPHKIWPYMVQYLHFRILEFPIDNTSECPGANEKEHKNAYVQGCSASMSGAGCKLRTWRSDVLVTCCILPFQLSSDGWTVLSRQELGDWLAAHNLQHGRDWPRILQKMPILISQEMAGCKKRPVAQMARWVNLDDFPLALHPSM